MVLPMYDTLRFALLTFDLSNSSPSDYDSAKENIIKEEYVVKLLGKVVPEDDKTAAYRYIPGNAYVLLINVEKLFSIANASGFSDDEIYKNLFPRVKECLSKVGKGHMILCLSPVLPLGVDF